MRRAKRLCWCKNIVNAISLLPFSHFKMLCKHRYYLNGLRQGKRKKNNKFSILNKKKYTYLHDNKKTEKYGFRASNKFGFIVFSFEESICKHISDILPKYISSSTDTSANIVLLVNQ